MSLDDKIKKAFKKEKKLIEANKWNPDLYPNIYEMENFLRKSGYRIIDIIEQKNSDIPEVVIEPIKKGYLYPEISHDLTDNKFYAKVIDYGMLGESDLIGIIQGYENAVSVIKHLNSLDLRDLEVGEDEE